MKIKFVMKRLIKNTTLIVFFMLVFVIGFSQKPNCNQGQQNKFNIDSLYKKVGELLNSIFIQSTQPVDPNEIIGLDGYDAIGSNDTFRWVAAMQTLAYTVYFENDADLAMAAASKIPLAHCVRGGMVRFADGRVGKRRAASENVPLPVTSSSPPFFFPFCLLVRNTIPRNVTTLSGISSVWQQTSKKCSLT